MAKVDCSHFFKGSSLHRGISRSEQLLDRVSRLQRVAAVAIDKQCLRTKGFLCKASSKLYSKKTHHIVPFTLIKDSLTLAFFDRYFSVGSTVLRRQQGFPICVDFSEPCTMVDLSHDIRHMHTSKTAVIQAGWIPA